MCSGNDHSCGCFLILKSFHYSDSSCKESLLFFALRGYVVTVISCIEMTPISWKALEDYQYKNDKGALFGINLDLLKIPLGNRDFFPAEPTTNSLK